MVVLGELAGLGAGTAFVGRAGEVEAGGWGFLARGITPSSLSSDDSKGNFRFLAGGWGRLGSAWLGEGGFLAGGGGRPPPPPPPPRCSPHTPPMLPHIPSSPPPPAYSTSYI